MERGTWSAARGAQRVERSAGSAARGAQRMEYRVWNAAHGTQHMKRCVEILKLSVFGNISLSFSVAFVFIFRFSIAPVNWKGIWPAHPESSQSLQSQLFWKAAFHISTKVRFGSFYHNCCLFVESGYARTFTGRGVVITIRSPYAATRAMDRRARFACKISEVLGDGLRALHTAMLDFESSGVSAQFGFAIRLRGGTDVREAYWPLSEFKTLYCTAMHTLRVQLGDEGVFESITIWCGARRFMLQMMGSFLGRRGWFLSWDYPEAACLMQAIWLAVLPHQPALVLLCLDLRSD